METEVKLTKLANCAGCGAKVGAGTLSKLLSNFKTHADANLLVGYDKSDDASVYKIDENTALVSTTDFFPPIVDNPYLYGKIAATNAFSDVYAMGGEPKLALNILCVSEKMDEKTIQSILKGGYDCAYEAGAIICGGHTIQGAEPIYGLSVNGFVHPDKMLTNANAKEDDVLILTKPLGVGIITTGIKAGMVSDETKDKIYAQMATLNKKARDIMVKYDVHSCTDVTGFGLLGHTYEMAQGSNASIHLKVDHILYHKDALDLASMGLVPAGAYRNRTYAQAGVCVNKKISVAQEDILYDPQTSGGLLMSISKKDAQACFEELKKAHIDACIVGTVHKKGEYLIYLE